MIIEVITEYHVDPESMVDTHPELYKEYTRWNGNDPESFVLYLVEEFGVGFIDAPNEIDYQTVRQV